MAALLPHNNAHHPDEAFSSTVSHHSLPAGIPVIQHPAKEKSSSRSHVEMPELLTQHYESQANQNVASTVVLPEGCGGDLETCIIFWVAWALVDAKQDSSEQADFGARVGQEDKFRRLSIHLASCSKVKGLLSQVRDFATNTGMLQYWGFDKQERHDNGDDLPGRFGNVLEYIPSRKPIAFHGDGTAPAPDSPSQQSFAIHIKCSVVDKNLLLTSDFDPETTSPAQMQRLLNRLTHVVLQLHRVGSDVLVSGLEMISPLERVQIETWNQISASPAESCVHEKISRWSKFQPSAEALCAWDCTITYEQLERYSTNLALYLVELGVGPNVLVPLCFERSGLAVLSMIAVAKAGGAFVPMDPSNPRSRNLEILKQTDSKILLVSEAHSHICPSRGTMVDWDLVHNLHVSKKTSLKPVDPKDLAYIIFTSGSTGKPKGVMIEHRSLSLSLEAHGKLHIYGQNSRSRVLQFASLAFDASMTEHLAPLSHGGTVCIPDQQTRMSDVSRFMNKTRVNWAFFTPSFFKTIEPEGVPMLRTVVLGGEAITDSCIDRWAGRIKLINGYGPSETTIVATACIVSRDTPHRSSIGRGLVCKTWVVDIDNHDYLAPIGTVGELVIQGPTVGRGYLGDAEKTRIAFITTPKWLRGGSEEEKLYKTGDIVRYEDDGSLTYLGRKDTQVKVRGQRLELSEIEYHLSMIPAIENSVVLFPRVGKSKGRLVAIMTFQSFHSESSNQNIIQLLMDSQKPKAATIIASIKENISNSLPSYMRPDVWIGIMSMPIIASGKIGRAILAQWLHDMDEKTFRLVSDDTMDGSKAATKFIKKAKSSTAKTLQMVWATALDIAVSSISVDVPLQNLGGDSITAIQILAKARKEGIELSIADILAGETITQLAAKATSEQEAVRDSLEECGRPFELSPIQQMYIAFAPQEKHHFNQSILLRLLEDTSYQKISFALRAVVQLHSMLRVRLRKDKDGRRTQVVTEDIDGSYIFKTHSVSNTQESDALIENSQKLVNSVSGPVLVASLINVHNGAQLLSLVAHHFVVDLVSWRIITDDLQTLICTGEVTTSESMPFQTWLNILGNHSRKSWRPSNMLPYDVPTPDLAFWGMNGCGNTYGEVSCAEFHLSEDISASFLEGCRKLFDCEPLDLFLSALLLSFARTFPDRDLPAIFNEGHGREYWKSGIDIATTVGWFTTLCPIYAPVEAQGDIWAATRRVQHVRKSIKNNGLAYFTSQFLNDETVNSSGNAQPAEIVFNYLGVYRGLQSEQSVFQLVPSSAGDSDDAASANMQRFSLFEVSAGVLDKQIRFKFAYNRRMRHSSRIEQWVSRCATILTEATTLPRKTEGRNYTCDVSMIHMTFDDSCSLVNTITAKLGLAGPDSLETVCPPTPIQKAMLHSQAEGLECYKTRLALRVTASEGGINCHQLQRAWNKLVVYHTILRTVFVQRTPGTPVYDQAVLRYVDSVAGHICCDKNILEQPLRLAPASWQRGQPGHKLTICENPAHGVACLLEISHTLIDHASLAIILQDLARFYSNDQPIRLASRYSTLVAQIENTPKDEALKYWRSLLQTSKPCRLTFRHTGPDNKSLLRKLRVPLSHSTTSTLAGSTRYTPSTIFRAAWALVLRQYTQDPVPTFGYIVSGRDVPMVDAQSIVGPLINILACHIKVDDPLNVMGLLEKVKQQFLDSLPHQHHYLTFAESQAQAGCEAAPTRRFFNTLVNFRRQAFAQVIEEVACIKFEPIGEWDPFDYDIVVEIDHEANNTFTVVLTYWTSTISDIDVKQVAEVYAQYIKKICHEISIS